MTRADTRDPDGQPRSFGTRRHPTVRHAGFAFAFILSCVLLAGCAADGDERLADGITQTDRLVRAYPELSQGRFTTIADFESEGQMAIVHLVNASLAARCSLDRKAGQADTGRSAAVFRAAKSGDAIIFRDTPESTNWNFQRDWRPFDLLMMRVFAPEDGLRANLTVSAGRRRPYEQVATRVPLQAGWNQVRLGLAELEQHADLDNVRELSLSINGLRGPTDVVIDDVLLTAFEKPLLGARNGPAGSLYAVESGRRWLIGAAEQFELAFESGNLVAWYDLRADRFRGNNLAPEGGLGPKPVIIIPDEFEKESDYDGPRDFSGLGEIVLTRQSLLELSSLRAVVFLDWRFVSSMQDDPADAPGISWVYVIYPNGDVYVQVASVAGCEDWQPRQLGLAVSARSPRAAVVYTHEIARLQDPEWLRHALFGYVRSPGPGGSSLLFAVPDSRTTPHLLAHRESDDLVTTLVAAGPLSLESEQRWAAYLRLLPPPRLAEASTWTAASAGPNHAENSAKRSLQRQAAAYADPPPLHVQAGSPAEPAFTSSERTGFDPATGCYVLTPDQNQIRFEIDSRDGHRGPIRVVVRNSRNRQVWVYVDNLLHQPVIRTYRGDVLFEVVPPPQGRRLVEVLLRDQPPAAGTDNN